MDVDSEIQALEQFPERWPTRRRLAERLLESGQGTRAAEIIWKAPSIPQEPFELAWVLRILGNNMPRRAVRLIHAIIEQHVKRPTLLVRLADALERDGQGLQAARLYGAAQQIDPALTDAEFESGLLALDAAGTAAAGIAGKGEVVGVLNWIPQKKSESPEGETPPEITKEQTSSKEDLATEQETKPLENKATLPPPAASPKAVNVPTVAQNKSAAISPASPANVAKEGKPFVAAKKLASVNTTNTPKIRRAAPQVSPPNPKG